MPVPRPRLRLLALAALAAFAASPAGAAPLPLVRVGSAARLPALSAMLGSLRPSTRVELRVALEPRDPSALAAFATAVSTPGSPDYGRFLSVRQFARRFGAPAHAIAAVRAALRRAGMSVGPVSANDLMVSVHANAATIARAMSPELARVELPDGRRAYANLRAPALPARVARYVQGVIGLDDVAPARPAVEHGRLATGGPQPSCGFAPAGANGAANSGDSQDGYSYDQIAAAYGFSGLYTAGDLGQGETIALLELQPYSDSDLATFQSCYGTDASVNEIDVDGGPGTGDNCGPSSADCDDSESALDIETAIALAPKAKIEVYEAPAASGIGEAAVALNQIVSDDTAKVVADSYADCEAATPAASISSENTSLEEAAAQGQSFLAASGDSGSEMCSQLGSSNPSFSTTLSVADPAAQPYATAVGGTELLQAGGNGFDDSGAAPDETVWNEGTNPDCDCGGLQANGFGGGSGGGISSRWPMPSYQSSAAASLGVIGPDSAGAGFCGQPTCREVPDVAADADASTGYLAYVSDGGPAAWGPLGGTSASTPLWAAFLALVDADPACRTLTIGFANPALYGIAGSDYAADFHDVQPATAASGSLAANNDTLYEWGVTSTNTASLYPVTSGYDMATGLGSMNAPALAASLCAQRAPVYSVQISAPGNQVSARGVPVSLQLHGEDSGAGTTLTYTAQGLPAGLAISSSGLITGSPAALGTRSVTITATDQFLNTASIRLSWAVLAPGRPQARTSVSGLARGRVQLHVQVRAGSHAPAISSVQLLLPNGLSITRRPRLLARGVVARAAGARVALGAGGGKLTLRLTEPERTVQVSVGSSAIAETSALETRIRRRQTRRLRIAIVVRDALGKTTRLAAVIRV